LPQTSVRVVHVDHEDHSIANHLQTSLALDVHNALLAYVMYTSGSTGQPKGVCVPHRAVARLALATSYIQLSPQDRVLHFAPASFDASTFEIWAGLLNGACVVAFDRGAPSIAELGRFVQQDGITTAWFTAPLFHQMVEGRLDDLRGVRNLLAGGDVLSPAHVRKVNQAVPECRMINGYGPTENTTFTCCGTAKPLSGDHYVPIGRPVDNTQIHLLDSNLEPVPVGVAGELFAGGDGLARGYFARAAITAAQFIPDPFGAPGARLYRTGDMARYLPDGNAVFVGRLDFQVKIRGFRIELEEIQVALGTVPGISECLVIAQSDASEDKSLTAYLVTNQSISAAEIRSILKQRLPEYMVPSNFVFLERMPLTPNGKIDRQALRAPIRTRDVTEDSYTAPRTPIEETLAGIWAEVLGLEKVGVDDNFFSLGGHSLLATRVVSRINGSFQIDLPLRRLFEFPTITGLAQAIDLAAMQCESSLPDIAPLARTVVAVPVDFDSLE
jgi:amino acid adenylation domain-containing protein